MVLGFNKPYVAAIISPDFEKLKRWCDENKVHWTAPQYMALNPKVVQFVKGIIEEINEMLNPTEKVREFVLVHHPWSADSGELTPTLKVKRPYIEKKYEKEIEELFDRN